MHVIYVDDEQPSLDNFRLTVAAFSEIDSLELFRDGQSALDWAGEHAVDEAFLDMEMPGLHGLDLAEELGKVSPGVRVVFVTAYSRCALDAWDEDGIGYVSKPYTAEDIRRELTKAAGCR